MTIKAEVLLALHASDPTTLTAPQILEGCAKGTRLDQVAQTLSTLKGERLVDHAGKTAPETGHALIRWTLTDAGREVVKDTPLPEAGKAPRGRVSRKPPKKAKPARRAKGSHKTKAKHKTKAGSRAARKAWKTRRAAAQAAALPAVTPAPRWAFTGDHSLVLLGTTTEIPEPAVRALVRFLRQLDATLVLEPEA